MIHFQAYFLCRKWILPANYIGIGVREISREIQNPKGDITEIAHGIENTVHLASAITDAFTQYLESRSFVDPNSSYLANYLNKGGSLRFMTVAQEDFYNFREILGKEGVHSVGFKALQDTGEKTLGVVYPREEEQRVLKVREMYLASQKEIFQVQKDVVQAFSGNRELKEYENLSFAEMTSLKTRAIYNGLMFASDKNDITGTYSVFCREEDGKKMDLLWSGVQQERNGVGKVIYEDQNFSRAEKENLIKSALANSQTPVLIGNGNGTQALYINGNGLYYEDRRGENAVRKEVSRKEDKLFEKTLCDCVDGIKKPRCIKGERAELLAGDMAERKERLGVNLNDALKQFGYKNLKDVRTVKMEKEQLKDEHAKEAFYVLQRSVDLYRTQQEGASRLHATETDQRIFNTEHQARMDFELCMNYGGSNSTMAQQYIDGDLSMELVQQFSKERVSDIRKNVVWREPYDMPEYIDRNNDNILDDAQPEVIRGFDMRAQDIEEEHSIG